MGNSTQALGRSPFHCACSAGHVEVTVLLVQAGADPAGRTGGMVHYSEPALPASMLHSANSRIAHALRSSQRSYSYCLAAVDAVHRLSQVVLRKTIRNQPRLLVRQPRGSSWQRWRATVHLPASLVSYKVGIRPQQLGMCSTGWHWRSVGIAGLEPVVS